MDNQDDYNKCPKCFAEFDAVYQDENKYFQQCDYCWTIVVLKLKHKDSPPIDS